MQHHIMYLLLFADKVKTIIAACAASMFTQCHAMHAAITGIIISVLIWCCIHTLLFTSKCL